MTTLDGVIASPNIWQHPQVYELENLSVDPDGVIEQAMRAIHDWRDRHLLDVGCGSGFHLPRFADDAGLVTGVEPHPPLLQLARRRVAGLKAPQRERIQVLAGSAQQLPLPAHSVDVAHARWAYFFGPGCEAGLAELKRVVRPGGTAFVIDNDPTTSTFGRWFTASHPDYDAAGVQRFWSRQGWTRTPLSMRWQMPDRRTFEQVVRIEFAPEVADWILAEHSGTGVDYAVNLWHRTFLPKSLTGPSPRPSRTE